jgi:hypothetical protein
MYFMTGWQEKSTRVRTLHTVENDLQDMTLIAPPKTNHENIPFNVRYLDVTNQVFPDWRMLATLVTVRPGKRPGEEKANMNLIENKDVCLRLVSNRGTAKNAFRGSEDFYEESHFNEMLNLEKKRSQRSMRPLMLMRLDLSGLMEPNPADAQRRLQQALASGIRETDVRGWYKRGTVVGIVFTELQSAAPHVRDILIRRVMARLVGQIDPGVLFKIKVTFHMFPEDEAAGPSCGHFELDCHQDLAKKPAKRDLSSRVRILKDVVANFLMT